MPWIGSTSMFGMLLAARLKFWSSSAPPMSSALDRPSFSKLEITNALIIDGAEVDTNFRNAARNIPHVDVLPIQGINVYDIMRRGKLVLTKAAVDALEARFK